MVNNKIKLNKNILSRILMSVLSITVAIAPLMLKSPVQAGPDGGIGICEEACTYEGNAAQSGDKVIFRWEGQNADFYHVRYRSGGEEKQVRNTSRSFTLNNVKPNRIYRLKVQACTSRFLASSKCSPWQEISFTTTAPDPATCKQGYVWREAGANDRVCVTPAVRTQTRNENAAAASRREPNGGAYGSNTCKQGYVWREAIANDTVCVTPAVRAQAAEDNKRAEERRIP